MAPSGKKIAFLITDLLVGGTPLLLRTLAEGLPAHGIQPTIISLKPFPQKSVSSFNHSSFEFDSSFVLRHSSLHSVRSLNIADPRDFPRAIRTLTRFLNQLRPDILFSMLIHANALAALTVPFLRHRPAFFQSLQTLQEDPGWHWNLQGVLSPFADAVIVPSQPILDKISKFGNINRGIVIPNGIDVERFAGATPIDHPPWPDNALVFGYVGRFDPVKNLPLLIRAFAALPLATDGRTPHLALVGYGPQEKELKNLATSLHLAPRVHFPGPTTAPERWYKSFAAHVLPSSIEGFGMTLVEAMAAGIPVIAPDIAVTRSIIPASLKRFLFSPGDSQSLTIALQTLTKRPPTSSDLSSTVEHARHHFSASEMVRKYAQFLLNFRG